MELIGELRSISAADRAMARSVYTSAQAAWAPTWPAAALWSIFRARLHISAPRLAPAAAMARTMLSDWIFRLQPCRSASVLSWRHRPASMITVPRRLQARDYEGIGAERGGLPWLPERA